MNNDIIYKYINKEDGMKVLENNTLKFSTPFDFNDPFDCSLKLLSFNNIPENLIKEHIDKGILVLEDGDEKLSYKELAQKADSIYNEEIMKEILKNLKEDLWISCFSKKNDEILMWSHYAKGHTGFCIGFNIGGLSETMEFILSKVKYKDQFNKIDFFNDQKKALENWISIKSTKWSYESEVRLRTNSTRTDLDNSGITKIAKESISEIYIGYKTELNNHEKEVLNTYEGKTKIVKMFPDEYSFQLNEQEFKL